MSFSPDNAVTILMVLGLREWLKRHRHCYCIVIIIFITASLRQKVEIPVNEQRSSRLDLMGEAKLCNYLWGRVRIKGAILIFHSSVVID